MAYVTDHRLLRTIYEMYEREFLSANGSEDSGALYVPIDCDAVGARLGLHPQIVFGRLYYHLDKKHGYRNDDGSTVHLFAIRVGEHRHAVNFPMLSAVLADLAEQHTRFTLPLAISLLALLLSMVGLA